NGCSSTSAATTVRAHPFPPFPSTTLCRSSTSFCQGGSVTLTSSAASGNQWLLNGSAIGGANSQTYTASASGNYSVRVTDGNGCRSTCAATRVPVKPLPPTPTISTGGASTS